MKRIRCNDGQMRNFDIPRYGFHGKGRSAEGANDTKCLHCDQWFGVGSFKSQEKKLKEHNCDLKNTVQTSSLEDNPLA